MNKGEQLLEIIRGKEAVNQVDFFDLGILTFTDDVRDMCIQNTCGRYDKSWNCPPAIGTIKELEALCKSFDKGILVNSVTQLEDSFDWEGMMAGGRKLAALCIEIDDHAATLGIKNYRVYGGGACHICEKCSYPDTPCNHPDRLYIPIEGCGINVLQFAKDAGFKYINGQNTVTFFGMILYNEE